MLKETVIAVKNLQQLFSDKGNQQQRSAAHRRQRTLKINGSWSLRSLLV